MSKKHCKKTKILNLVTSLLVTAVCILVWHFVLPYIGEKTNLVKLMCYGILLFDTIWITDAALSLWNPPADLSNQERAEKTQRVYAIVGFVVFLLYSALAHAVVAVFDGKNTAEFMIGGISKCALAVIGFSLLLTNALNHETERRIWTIISGIATFAVGIIFSTFLSLDITSIIMCIVVAIYFFVDVFITGKKMGIAPVRFSLWSIIYIAVMALALLILHFIPIHFGNHVLTYLVRGIVNLVFALVIDAIIILVSVIMHKRKKQTENC